MEDLEDCTCLFEIASYDLGIITIFGYWRMHLASVWLGRDRLSISEVARRLGYQSEPAFSRAFKRLLGVPLSRFRQGTRNGSTERIFITKTQRAQS
jgi:AraC-like DNA-binding protein